MRVAPTREELMSTILTRTLAEAEPTRTTVAIGCHLLGWFDSEPLDWIVAELVAAVADPGRLAALGWPRSCLPWPWPWSPGRDVAVWRSNRLLALVSRDAAGVASVRRFD